MYIHLYTKKLQLLICMSSITYVQILIDLSANVFKYIGSLLFIHSLIFIPKLYEYTRVYITISTFTYTCTMYMHMILCDRVAII